VRKQSKRARRGMATVDDLGREVGVSKGVAYDLVESGAVPASRAGRRYLISWETIARIKSGELTFRMPCRSA
jgi:excisionase family DNA binding protein